MTQEYKYLYGPVPSRRLGLSLGVDIMPAKVCTLDCLYCQIGKTTNKTLTRKEYLPVKPVLEELKERLEEGLTADYITLSGSGEPTLNERFGELIDGIKAVTSIPVAVLTNGTLLMEPPVRQACAKADVVIPSLDAGDQETFVLINRPHSELSIDKIIDGLVLFRQEYAGQIWLEVFFVESVNTGADQIESIKRAIEKIRPDKIQLNTAVRPTVETVVEKLSNQKLQDIAQMIGFDAEVIADFSNHFTCAENPFDSRNVFDPHVMQTVLSLLKRRPCSLEDVSTTASISPNLAVKYIAELLKQGRIQTEQKANKTFYSAQ